MGKLGKAIIFMLKMKLGDVSYRILELGEVSFGITNLSWVKRVS